MSTTISSTSDTIVISAADSVQSELDLLTARLRRDVWLYGLLAVTATAVGMLLATIISDAIFQPESTGLRFVLWISVLTAVAVAIYRIVWSPLRDRCNSQALAWSLEEQRPELQEGLTTTLLLAGSKQPAAASLVDAVAAQANRNLADCRDDAATRRDIRKPGLAAASCMLIAAFCFAMWPQYLMPSMSNVLAPWNARQLPYLTAAISPGHVAVAEGEALKVSASGDDLDACVLEVIDHDAVLYSTPMTATANGNEADVLLTGLTTDQAYRVRSGSLVSDVFRITVHPQPVVVHGNATLQFPEYSRIQPATVDNLSVPITALPGTQVRLSVATVMPISDAMLTFGDRQQGVAETKQVKGLWWRHWNLTVDEQPAQTGHVKLISEHGVSSEPFSFEIQGVPDKPPTVSITTPSLQHLAVQPDGQLSIQFEAADDFGMSSVEVLIQAGDAEPDGHPVQRDLAAADHSEEYIFQPQEHGLKAGDQLVLWLVAADNRTEEYGGFQSAKSRQLMITVTDDALSVGAQQVIDEECRILDALSDTMDRLKEARETAEQIAEAARQANAHSEDGAQGVPADINTDAQELQRQLQEAHQGLAKATESNEDEAALFKAEKQQVRDIADGEVEEARHQARLIPLTSDSEQQQRAADAASSAIEQAEEKLTALKEQLGDRAEKLQQAAELDELARQQNELSRQLEEPEQPQQQVEPKQEQIADRLQELVDDDPDAASEQFLQRAETAEQLAERTTQLQDQQQQLTDATESKSDEETRKQLAQMIRTEQEAVAAENQRLTQEGRQDAAANTAKEDAAAEAQNLMEQVPHDLAEQNLKAAEQNAQSAKQNLQEAAGAKNAADNGERDQQREAISEKRNRLAKRQERIEEAIRAVRDDDFEAAKNELQELITERLEQVAKEAEELLELPTDDEVNQKARDDAQQELRKALNDSKQALAKPEDQKPANATKSDAQQQPDQKDQETNGKRHAPQKNDPKQEQAEGQSQAGQKDARPKQQADAKKKQSERQAQQNGQPAQQDQKVGDPEAPQQGDPKQDHPEKQNEASKKNVQSKQQDAAEQKQTKPPTQQNGQPAQQNQKKGEPQAQQQGDPKQEKAAKQNKAGEKDAPPQQQAESGQKSTEQQAQQEERPVKQDQKSAEAPAQQGDQKQDQAAKRNEAGQKSAPPKQHSEAGQKQAEQQADQKQQPSQKKEKKSQPQDELANNEQSQNKSKPQQQKQNQKQQQNKAAQSLKKASESLQQFCKSCQKCANCNKSGKSGSSSGNSSKPGNKRPGDKDASNNQAGKKQSANKQLGGKQAGAKPAGGKRDGDKLSGGEQPGQSDEKKNGTSQQLAKATDNAQRTARNPTPGAAKELAQELEKLADKAAQESNYPQRTGSKGESGRGNNGSRQAQKSADSRSGNPDGSKSSSGEPTGVGRDSQPDDVGKMATQLRGPSSSEWTRSHKRLRGNVLDRKSTQIPEAYRGVVGDYFEQLSRIESDDKQEETSK